MPPHRRRVLLGQRRRRYGGADPMPLAHLSQRAVASLALATLVLVLAAAGARADSAGWSGTVSGTYTHRGHTVNRRTEDASITATSDGLTATSDGTVSFDWKHREESVPCDQGGVAYVTQTAHDTKFSHQAISVSFGGDGTYAISGGGDASFDYFNDYYDCATDQ